MSLKKAKDYLGNDLQVDSAIKDAKGQVIHKTYIKKTIPDGTIAKNIGVDSNGDIVKETPSSGGMTNPMTTQGDIIVGGSSGTPQRLPKGTAGQVLTMNDGATAPEWKTPSGGGGTQLYKHMVGIDGEGGMGMPLDDVVSLIFITSSSTPITTAQLVINNNEKLIYGAYDGSIIYGIQDSGGTIGLIMSGAPLLNVTPTDITDTVTPL